jgi:hypothetical protein
LDLGSWILDLGSARSGTKVQNPTSEVKDAAIVIRFSMFYQVAGSSGQVKKAELEQGAGVG